jgi:hypothetical protein
LPLHLLLLYFLDWIFGVSMCLACSRPWVWSPTPHARTHTKPSFFLSFFCRDLNSGPPPWTTPPALFHKGFFWDRVLWTICPGLTLKLWSSWSLPLE